MLCQKINPDQFILREIGLKAMGCKFIDLQSNMNPMKV